MTARRAALALLLGSLALGCAPSIHVAHVRTGPALAPKSADAPIPVFFNERPSIAYREIAQIRVRARDASAKIDDVLRVAVDDARSLGADALIIDLRAHYASVPVTVDCEGRPIVPPTDRLNARATAIVFVPGDRQEPEPTGPTPRRICARAE